MHTLSCRVDEFDNRTLPSQAHDTNFLAALPLSTDEEFQIFGAEIETNQEKRISLVYVSCALSGEFLGLNQHYFLLQMRHFRRRSDSTVHKTVKNILRCLLQDHVLHLYSRDGKRNKKVSVRLRETSFQ